MEEEFRARPVMRDAKERLRLVAELNDTPAKSMIFYVNPDLWVPVLLQRAYLWVKHYIFRRPL